MFVLKRPKQALIFIISLFFCSTSLMADDWFNTNFDELMKIRETIFNSCPPSACVYVGVGRSPTAVTAFLAASLQPKDAERIVIDIPVTGMQRYPELDANAKEIVHSRFDQVFDKYLPREKIEGKRVVLIDAASSGDSLAGVYDELNRYVSSHNIPSQVEGVGLSFSPGVPEAFKNRTIQNIATPISSSVLWGGIRSRYGKYERVPITRVSDGEPFSLPNIIPEVEQRYADTVVNLRRDLNNKNLTLTAITPNSTSPIQRAKESIMRLNPSMIMGQCLGAIRGILSP